jgi:hypothetical protein
MSPECLKKIESLRGAKNGLNEHGYFAPAVVVIGKK